MNPVKGKQIFVVLGMHRNGTSLITRSLKLLGVDLGNRLLPPMNGVNEKGFWEDVDINALNIDLLKALGQDWHSLRPIVATELASLPSIDEFTLRAIEILRNRLDNTNHFGLKDPRICRLLPFWEQVFEHLQLHVNYVIAYRNPMSVVSSLAKRDCFDLEKSYYLWLEHMLLSLTFTANHKHLVVNYDSVIEDSDKQLQRIALYFGLVFTPQGSEYLEYKTNFLDESLRHTQFHAEDLELDKSSPPIVIKINKALVELASDAIKFDDPDISSLIQLANEQIPDNHFVLSYIQTLYEKSLLLTNKMTVLYGQIINLNQVVTERDGQIINLKDALGERDSQISKYHNAAIEREEIIHKLVNSNSWIFTKPMRFISRTFRGLTNFKSLFSNLKLLFSLARPHILIILRNPKQIKSKLHFLKLALVSGGLNQVIKKLKQSTSIDFMTMSVNTDKLVLELMQQLVSSPRKINVVELLSAKKVTVVIPVYRGFNETRRCIESAIQNTNIASHEIILINDCSPEPQIKNLLHSYTNKHPHIHVVTNNENLGFVKTVNIGMKLAGNADVILLNSDTVVANNWLDKLINQAYINDNIGTVTPFSNNATICSYPDIDGWVAIPDGEDVSSLDKACKIANEGRYIEIPTAVGFCMYIKRSCLKDVGFFDEKSFGKGYGEENDFCLRAIKKGWKHILATDIFVFHAGEVSFSKSAEEKKLNAMNVLRARYPYYERIVNAHVIKNEAYSNRLAITAARYRMDNRSVVLFITHRYSGGTEKHIQEIADAISVNNARVLILRPANEENGCDVLLEAHCKNDKLKLYLTSKNLELLAGVLKFFGLNKVHVHHVIGYRFDIEELVYLVGAPYDVTIHDFYFICPRINLITPGSGFCGTPSVSDCNACLTMEPKIGESVEIIWWRVKYGSLLNGASSVYCPSKDVADRIIEHLPLVKIHVVPHEVYHLPEIRKGFSKREIKRFAILGVLAEHKGLSLVESALVEINKKNLPIEFVLIGYPEKHLKENKYFRSTGKYNDVDLASLIDDVDPDAILFPVCWPETYSYTLTTALLSGRPIVAPSIGAFSERLQGVSNGYIYPVNLSSSQLVSFLLSLLISNFEEKVDCSNNQLFFPKPFKVVNTFYSSPEYILFEGPSEIESPIVKSKPTLLIIPEFSGSFLSPCSYIRILEIIATPTFKKEFNIRLASIKSAEEISADIVLINRVPTSNISELDSLLSHLRRTGAKLVYDIDDELLNLPDTHSEFTVYKERQNVIRRLLFEADSVWTSTEALANSFKPIARNIHIFENYLDYKLFDQLDADIQSTPDDIFNILYMGTSTHAADLDLVLDALRKLDEDGMKFNLYLIGITTNIPLFDWVKVINPPVTVYPLFRQWLLTLDFFDLGIAPLQLGDFNNCKSDIKFWDYTSMGIPTLASEVTAYRSIIVNGENGFLTKNHTEDWYIKIKEIMKNRPKLKSILIRARETLKSMHIQIDGVEKRKKVLTELLWQD